MQKDMVKVNFCEYEQYNMKSMEGVFIFDGNDIVNIIDYFGLGCFEVVGEQFSSIDRAVNYSGYIKKSFEKSIFFVSIMCSDYKKKTYKISMHLPILMIDCFDAIVEEFSNIIGKDNVSSVEVKYVESIT